MKYIELVEKTGIEICEGGPFGYLDFGPAWVHLYDCQLSVVVRLEDHVVVMVEWFDEVKNEINSWVNPEITSNMREEEVEGVKSNAIETVDEVLNLWSSYKAEKYGDEGSFPDIENGSYEDIPDDETEIH